MLQHQRLSDLGRGTANEHQICKSAGVIARTRITSYAQETKKAAERAEQAH